ncbi:DUF6525 family protein [Celeribacter marinus]|uniref:DUF6525 family protein n=1 Tax=Celeribacter marinus TaxID=1397108 RepID=UPI003F6CC46D
MTDNLGHTTLKKRRRAGNPMATYDALPQPLRLWLAGAALPWSPRSCKRIWDKARSQGLCMNGAISALAEAERKTLSRERR